MSTELEAIAAIKARFPEGYLGEGMHADQRWVIVRRQDVIAVLTLCRDQLGFDMLMDLTAVDYLNQGTPERFTVVYELYSLANNEYFRVKTWVPEGDPEVDTASGVWLAAPWAEREVFDMFGITFKGHKDLRRILTPFEYTGHPLRKDYPLKGRGERANFPKLTR